MNSYEYLLQDINSIKGIGTKTSKLFRKKNINTIFDILWSLPRNSIDRTNLVKINELQIGKIQTITVNVIKYNFPRIRNLPNKVICEDETSKIDIVFFNGHMIYVFFCQNIVAGLSCCNFASNHTIVASDGALESRDP